MEGRKGEMTGNRRKENGEEEERRIETEKKA